VLLTGLAVAETQAATVADSSNSNTGFTDRAGLVEQAMLFRQAVGRRSLRSLGGMRMLCRASATCTCLAQRMLLIQPAVVHDRGDSAL
jgi:hypothetical protein